VVKAASWVAESCLTCVVVKLPNSVAVSAASCVPTSEAIWFPLRPVICAVVKAAIWVLARNANCVGVSVPMSALVSPWICVVVSVASWLWTKASPKDFMNFLNPWLTQEYDLVGGYLRTENARRWVEPLTDAAEGEPSLLLYKRKTSPADHGNLKR